MAGKSNQIRVLDLSFESGARQLAITEAIMQSVAQGSVPPTLRLYSWSEPVVIIGVGQSTTDLDLETTHNRGYRVLRRIGGGTAVYHDANEVSVDLIVPAGSTLGPTDVHAGYRQFAGLLSDALAQAGIQTETVSVETARSATNDEIMRPLCFASISPYEFLNRGRKLNGLCQIRRRDVIAYQAALYNRFDPEPLVASLAHDDSSVREKRLARIDNFVTDMETVRGERVDYTELQDALIEATIRLLDASVTTGSLTGDEIADADRLVSEKYASDGWTYRK